MQVPRPRSSQTRPSRGQVAPPSSHVVHMSLGIRDAGTRRKLLWRDGSSGHSWLSWSLGQHMAECALMTAALAPFVGVPTGGFSDSVRGSHGPGLSTTLIGAELSDKRPRFYFLV